MPIKSDDTIVHRRVQNVGVYVHARLYRSPELFDLRGEVISIELCPGSLTLLACHQGRHFQIHADLHAQDVALETAQKLFDVAFDRPRPPRSEAYRRGVLSALKFHLDAVEICGSYEEGTAEADAFSAGRQEGHAIWRDYQGCGTPISADHLNSLVKEISLPGSTEGKGPGQ